MAPQHAPAGKSKKQKVPLDEARADKGKDGHAVDDAGPARHEPEDLRETARRTTPAGKGRSQ